MTVAQLVPTKSDADLAAEFKKRLIEVYEKQLIPVLDEALAAGFYVNAQIQPNGFGRNQLNMLEIVKKF